MNFKKQFRYPRNVVYVGKFAVLSTQVCVCVCVCVCAYTIIPKPKLELKYQSTDQNLELVETQHH